MLKRELYGALAGLSPACEDRGPSRPERLEAMATRRLETFREQVGTLVRCFTGYRDPTGHVVRHGRYECASKDGRVIERGKCRHGFRHGKWFEYHDTGQLRCVSEYQDGKHNGTLRTWYADGSPEYVWPYRDNLLHGVARTYYENGRIREEARYERGRKNGLCKAWSQAGILLAEGVYQEDVPTEGMFLVEGPVDEDQCQDFREYVDRVLQRPRSIVEFRQGKAVSSRPIGPAPFP